MEPIENIFKIMDVKEEGIVPRLDLVKAIRNESVKRNQKCNIWFVIMFFNLVLNLSISMVPGSPTVN